jgi:hypothetical protein
MSKRLPAQLVAVLLWLAGIGPAAAKVTYDGNEGVRAQIFAPNCLGCHSSTLSGSARNGAPASVNFNTYALATSGTNETRAVARVTAGTMPPSGSLSLALKNLIQGWENDVFLQRAAPDVTTSTAISISQTGARLRANLAQNGTGTSVVFQFGLTTSYGTTTAPPANIGSGGGLGTTPVSRAISGLACGTLHHFRGRATNSNGTRNGLDRTFTTVSCSPVITTNTGLTVNEGGTGLITSARLSATDADNTPGQLMYTITSGPTNGTVRVSGSPVSSFTQAQINANSVSYVHNDSQTTSDSFAFTLSDGVNTVPGTFSITVNPINDPPIINTNAGLTVGEGDSGVITSAVLSASDVDNTPAQLTYTITSGPSNGAVQASGSPVSSFTQAQINTNSVSYVHDGSETISDSFAFTLSDGTNTVTGTFNIAVTSENDPPVINTNTGLTLDEGAAAPITSGQLSAIDPDNTPAQLTYTITTPPINGEVRVGGSPANSFTQAEINAGSVSYQHDDSETTADNFNFTLSDGAGGSVPGTFNITVIPPPPDLVVSALSVSKTRLSLGESFTIDATVKNQDGPTPDTGETTLRYLLSDDSTISTGDTPIGTPNTDTVPLPLARGATSAQSTGASAPTTPGTFFIGACVDAVPGEINTGNNCSSGVQITVEPPDLVVSALSVSKTDLSPGEPFTINATVRNQLGNTPSGTTLRYFRSTDSTISGTGNDTEIGTDAVPQLARGGTSAESIAVSAPTTSGTFFIGACVDAVGGETNTGNNCFTPGVQITVTLLVTLGATPAPARVGETVSWAVAVSNLGPGPATAVVLDIELHAHDVGLTLEQAVAGCSLVMDEANHLNWTCALRDLPASRTVTIRFSVTTTQGGDMWARAAVRSAIMGIDPPDNAVVFGLNVGEQFSGGAAQILGSANSRAAVLGDVNTDGSLDVVVITGTGASTEIYLNDGAGGFTQSASLGDSATSRAGVLADIDNDGGLDLILANASPNTVYFNNGSGTFSLSSQSLGTAVSHDVAAADLDGDGSLDLAFANASPNTVYFNNGSGTFIPSSQSLGTADSRGVAVADVDGDGSSDLIFANADGASTVYLNDGAGIFSLAASLGTGGSRAVSTADFDRDGLLDLAFANAVQSAADATPPFNRVYLGDGTGGFTPVASVGHVDTLDIATGDVNRDDLTDLVVINATGGHQVYLGDGTGGFTLHPLLIVGTGAVAGVLDDLDGDRDLDLVLSNGAAGGSSIMVNGGGGFGQPLSNPPTALGVGGGGGGGCFIATAAYGSALAAEIDILRRFRDRLLLPTQPGRAFVGWYYRTSPPYAAALAQHPRLRQGVRVALWPVVYSARGILWIGEYPYGAMAMTLILSGFLVLTRYRRRRVHRYRYQPRNPKAQTHG